MSKALVTGANGFLGANIVRRLLAEGVAVRALVRAGSDLANLEGLEIEFSHGDLRDEASLRRALTGTKWLFHAAADYRLHVPKPAEMRSVNVEGTRRLLELAGTAGVERVVYTSSVSAVAPRPDGRPADETSFYSDAGSIVSTYKRSKYEAENEVLKLAAAGLPVVIVNPAAPVGEYDRKPTPTGKMLVEFLNRRMPAYVETGLCIVSAADAAEGHWLALKKGRLGERYILGGDNLRLQEIFGLLAEATGLPAPAVRLPYAAAYAFAWLDTHLLSWGSREPRAPLDGVRMARRSMFFDSSKAARELGWKSRPAREALREAARWYVENGFVREKVPAWSS
jgi:dihydroflavonol-4-reductase